MWKKLNSILQDKNDYHLDPSLKSDVEISDELFQTTIKYQKYLIPRKIKYFFEYDKLFFLRLLLKYFLKLFVILLIIVSISVILLLAFGIDINLNVKKVAKTDYSKFPIYIPSTGESEKDSLNIIHYRKTINKDANFIIFYLKDPSKNYEKWKGTLAGIESGGSYDAKREGSQYWGKYQFSEAARSAIGLGGISWEKWKSNPEIQEAAIRLWIDILYQELKSDIKKYDGTFQNGWVITESGIIAMAHNVGSEPVKLFLHSGGKNVPKDGSEKDATRFLILGNYDLEINK